MTEQAPNFFDRSIPPASAYVANLLHFYGFELEERTIAELVVQWQAIYPENWVRLAVIEALYQGRYKAVSVEQILAFWQRREQPIHHFNHDFERLICNKLPRDLSPVPLSSGQEAAPSRSLPTFQKVRPSQEVPLNNVLTFPTLVSRPGPEVSETEASESELITPELPAPELTTPELITPELPTEPKTDMARILSVLDVASAPASDEREAINAANLQSDPSAPPKAARKSLLSLPNFGLTPPHLSLKLKVQLASLYQPNWIVPAAKQPLHRFVSVPTSDYAHINLGAQFSPERSDQTTIALHRAAELPIEPPVPQASVAVPDPWGD